MKAEIELQRAHDILVGYLLKEVPAPTGLDMRGVNIAASVLCWCLNHDHNPTFQILMRALEKHAEERGFTIIRPDQN